MKEGIEQLLRKAAPVVPVITLNEGDDAIALADCLAEAGISTLEITLRTPQGMQAIGELRGARPELVVGAGTVMSPAQVQDAGAAGAQFLVSPGYSLAVAEAAKSAAIPYLPGTATLTEMMTVRDAGLTCAKLFPAAVVGGVALLNAAASVLPDLWFCPTGGVNADNLAEYLAAPNVLCVGGSWVCPPEAVHDADWPRIRQLAGDIQG